MLIHAARRAKNDTTAEAVYWTVEAAEYEAGKAEIEAAVPDGWVLLSIRVDR